MVTVVLKVRLDIPGIGSLKEKRRILKSLIARLKNDFNISISEVDDNDRIRSAVLGAAIVSNSNSFGHQVINKVMFKLESSPEYHVIESSIESY